MRIPFNSCLSVAPVAPLLGILTVLTSLAMSVAPANAVPASSWAQSNAEREQLGKQFQGLVTAGKTDEAVAVAEKLIAADRRIADPAGRKSGDKDVIVAIIQWADTQDWLRGSRNTRCARPKGKCNCTWYGPCPC